MLKYKLEAHKKIKKSKDFQNIQRSGEKIFSKNFLLIFKENNLENSRIGVVVSKKVSKRANKRNQVKRRLREIFRLAQHDFTKNIDLVIIAKKEALEIDYQEYERQILGSLKYNKLIT